MYLMLLSDSIIAGFFIGESGVAGINGMWAGFAATPILTLIFAMLFVYQHPYVKKKLIETGNYILVEDSPTDSFWGCGPNRDGTNMLGVL